MVFVDGSATAAIELRNNVTPSVLLSAGVTAQFNFVASGDLVQPTIPISVLVLDSEAIRVDFSAALAIEAATTVAANYRITTVTPGAVEPTVKQVFLPDVEAPEFLIIQISEMTDAAAYEFAVVGDVNGQNGVPIASDSVPFTGVGVFPFPELIVGTSETTARVEFSEQMKPVGDISNPAAYTFSDGLLVEAVTAVGPNFVELRTTAQDPSILYTVTLTGVFLDGANNAMSSPAVTAMLGFQPFDVPERILRLRIYRFVTEIIRLEDQRQGQRFVERYLEGPQQVWDRIYNSILSLPVLWNVEEAPGQFLKFLKNIVGWTRPLEEITDTLDNDTLRRLIASSVAFWKSRGPEDAIESILRLTTSARLRILNWFDFRWINDEQHLGWEWDDEADPWVVSDYTSQLKETVTLAGTHSAFSGTEIVAMPIPAGTYDGMVVFVVLNSNNIDLDSPPVYRSSTGVERPLHPLGVITTATENNVGRTALSAWMINGLDGSGGELDVKPKSMGTNGVGLPVVRAIARTCVGLDRRRNVLFFSNSAEGSTSVLNGGARAIQECDPILTAICLSPAGTTPNPDAPMTLDADLGAAGDTVLRTGFFPGTRDGDEYQWTFDGAATHALAVALALTGKETALEVSGGEVVYQIRIVDDGTLNKDLVRALARLTRPVGERVDILYLGFLDLFRTNDDDSQWTDELGLGSVVVDGFFRLNDDTQDELSYVSVPQSTVWREYVLHTRVRILSDPPSASQFEIGTYFTDIDNRYYVEFVLDSGAAVGTPSTATINVRKVVGGVDTLVETGVFDDMFRQVFYTITLEIVRDDNTNTNEIRVLVDENIALSATDDALDNGSITVGHAIGSAIEVDAVEMHFVPADTDSIDLARPPLPKSSDAATTTTAEDCPVPTSMNKNMPALLTTSDGDLATTQPMALTPKGHVSVDVNGLGVVVGDGVKSRACYFSDDGGTTAKTIADIEAGDLLCWNGTIAGYQLEAGWRIDFNYNVI